MTEFIYKVASRGEGKTKWLLNQAKNELDAGEKVVLLSQRYRRIAGERRSAGTERSRTQL